MDRPDNAKRRKRDDSTEGNQTGPSKTEVCVIHFKASKCDTFTYLSQTKDPNNRIQHLHNIRVQRLQEPPGSASRMEEACDLIPSSYQANDGYHRDCYQRFTMNLNRLSRPSKSSSEPSCSTRTSRRSSSDGEKQLFNPDCIFCKKQGWKKVKVKGTWTTEMTSRFEYDGGETIKMLAEMKKDDGLLIRIRGVDLFASEAQYHRSCHRQYIADPQWWRSRNEPERLQQMQLEEAHSEAFSAVCRVIDTNIIHHNEVMKLSDLCSAYISALEDTCFPNKNYRSSKLREKLQRSDKYRDQLRFARLAKKGQYQTYLVYSSAIDVETAVIHAFTLGQGNPLKEVAQSLRSIILDAFKESSTLPWPPTAHQLARNSNVVPDELTMFLRYLFTGTSASKTTSKVARLIGSIGQDICRASTNGQWKLPKHILICMTLRHLFRSAELITMMNRFGHSENYSFSLELETALAVALQQTSSLLSTQIIRSPSVPSVFHSDFDNFDQFVNELTGAGSIHTAHGIMIQDVEGIESGGSTPDIPSVVRSGERSLKTHQDDSLPECYVTQRRSPSYHISRWVIPDAEEAMQESRRRSLVWILIRLHSCSTNQEVPSLGGFISVTGVMPSQLSTIDYYPVINHPITDHTTVQECLRYSEAATQEVGQNYVLTTFDLGVCMKAYPIVWNNPMRYEKHIILIGTFHLICAYMRLIGKKMAGSGLADVLIEAGLITSGSLHGVLSGKNYSRAIHCHKVLLESLERLLMQQYLSSLQQDDIFDGLSDESKDQLQDLIDSPCQRTLVSVLKQEDIVALITGYITYKDTVKKGLLGKTAQLWLAYMDHVWLILDLVRAVKCNNFLLYSKCLSIMPDLFFSFDGQNYARYLTYFSVFIANVEESHPGATELLERGAISIARSFIPGNRTAVDKTIEETFMRQAKSRGGAGGGGTGLTGILNNYDAYQRWVKTTHERSLYVEATLNMADMLDEDNMGKKHRDMRPAEIQKSEKAVQKAKDAFESFNNPFSVEDKSRIYSISSGAPAPPGIESDVLMAEAKGKQAKEVFIKDRLEKKDKFFEPVKRLRLKTLAETHKTVKLKTSKNKVVEYKQQGNVAFQLLVRSQSEGLQLDLQQLMSFPLTPVPYSIGTADGYLSKTDKSKGVHHLTKEVEDATITTATQTLVVEDGNAYFHYMTEVPANFKQISHKVFDMMQRSCDMIFSTDTYKSGSIKAMERKRRGCGEKLMIKGESTKKPADWKLFLSNDENKKQLIQLMCDVWSSADFTEKLQNRQVIFVCEGTAYLMTTSQNGRSTEKRELQALSSTQEETDSRVILYCMYAMEK